MDTTKSEKKSIVVTDFYFVKTRVMSHADLPYHHAIFTIPPCNSSYTNIFIETVENQIRNGVLIGSFIDNGYLVSWVSTRNGEDEYVEITIEEIE